MTLRSDRSIRRRLTIRLLGGMLSFAVVLNTLLYLYLRGELIEQYDQSLVTEARAIVSVIETTEGDAGLAARLIEAFPRLHFENNDGAFLQLWDSKGETIFRSPSLETSSFGLPPSSSPNRRGFVYDASLPRGYEVRATTLPLASPATAREERAPRVMVLGERRHELDKTLRHLAVALASIGGGLSAAAVVLVVYGVRAALSPLDQFAREVGDLNVDILSIRFPSDGLAAELKPFAARLNDLLARLDESLKRERRFSGNVAHELRTPVAELRTMLDVATRWPPPATEVGALHRNLLDVTERTSLLLASLLDLHRHQGERRAVELEPIELGSCIDEAWRPHEAAAAGRHLHLRMRVPVPLSVSANRVLLVALLSNLFQNAASYATASSVIELSVDRSNANGRVIVRLVNQSHDVTADDVRYFNEPFWRKDHARSDRHHVGLGLSVVQEYARVMGMTYTSRMDQPGRVTVELACDGAS